MPNIGGTIVPPEPNCAGPERYTGNAIIVIHFENDPMLYTNFANPKIGPKGLFDNNEAQE